MIKYKLHIILAVCLLGTACRQEEGTRIKQETGTPSSLFEQVSLEHSGVGFKNTIPESAAMNSMVYEYFYNGGGVAIGDVDNDGLPDMYFTANLVDNKLYKNKGNLQFEDITESAKVKGSFGWTTGVSMADVNADGWLDIYVCKSGKGKAKDRENLLYINNQDGTFTERAAEFGLNFPGYSTQASFFDYDRDGDLDMFLLNHNVTPINTNNPEQFKNEKNELVGDCLFRNDNGKFTNVSEEAGIIRNSMGFGLGVSVGDLNRDGWPDIYVGNDYIEQDYLYFNNGDGTFSEQIKSSMGHTSNFSMGTDMADINNDGLPDILSLDMVAEDNYGIKTSMSGMNPKAFNHAVDHGFHYQYMYNALQLNNGRNQFSEIGQLANISSTDWSWAPLFADFDNDGHKDLLVTNGLKRDFRNNDFKKYKLKRLQQAKENGEKMSAVIEELVKKSPQRKATNYLFQNNGNHTFSDKSLEWGIKIPTFSNGAAYADLDNDGDLDLVINNIDEAATILENKNGGNFVQFQFQGSHQNKWGIGTQVSVETENGTQFLENYPTRGYQSSVEPLLHFGLSNNGSAHKITVTWPDGKIQELTDVPVNQKMVLDYKDAQTPTQPKGLSIPETFREVSHKHALNHRHHENDYDDFLSESLLPHKMSQEGPALAVGDINNDGLDDFYVGGAENYPGALYVQDEDGKFKKTPQQSFTADKKHEDVDAIFFDADQDGDLDLYVVSGSNQHNPQSQFYADRFYHNHQGQFTKVPNAFDQPIFASGSVVRPNDFDQDGDLDLFVGGRQLPGQYPHAGESTIWRNDSQNGQIKFTNINEVLLEDLGMVTDAVWGDMDGDGWDDLVIGGEWMPITILKNHKGSFSNISQSVGLQDHTGWWFGLEVADFDQDGDMDIVAGNLGLNSKYQASISEPFEIYSKDFDQTGSLDIVLGYHQQGKEFPLRGRECSSNQMPFIKEKFPTYHDFASASLEDVYGKENLASALHYKAKTFATTYFENSGDGQFTPHPLPALAQQTTVREILSKDINKDGHLDMILLGNLLGFEVETPRQDAGYGLVLLGDGKGGFKEQSPYQNGLYINGEVAKASPIRLVNGKEALLVARNNDSLQLWETQ
ncbi:VCBS repeat-containing protein [Flagellimonas myxillae]|uniref:VCBS repeat-containing protein n=1 Tax=Flagellimonas myxillae TaxID=2942214 RepID=UPI00201ED81A|nr:VCBS repeat-containing protein [Muricauda myxillae]MCL6267733.1 VCBS repeat-containing protein [Muricauda myxillae]